jgi:hypothetical protein
MPDHYGRQGAPTHVPWKQTAHGGTLPMHGSQQSLVTEHPLVKNGTHGSVVVVGCTHRAAGPGQHDADPAGSTHTHTYWHVPSTHRSTLHPLWSSQSASVWHGGGGSVVVVGGTHSDDGPGQQRLVPSGARQTQPCSQTPFTHWSAVHGSPSLQSASLWHPGSVVVVVEAHTGLQSSFGFRHG